MDGLFTHYRPARDIVLRILFVIHLNIAWSKMGQQKAQAKKVHYGGHFGMNTSAIKPPFHARTKH